MRRVPTAALGVLLALAGCESAGSDQGKPALAVAISESPLALGFSFEETALTALADPGRSALYLADGAARVELTGAPTRSADSGGTTLTYHTTDGREAAVRIEPVEQGAVRVRFSVDDRRDGEVLGARFQVSADEGFYGLMERVVQGDQRNSWEPGMTEALDLRGQEVFLAVRPTVSAYSPFYVSSQGYGVYVESSWPGLYRFGVVDAAEVTLEYEGPDLTLRVIPGPTPLQVTERYARTVGTTLLPPRWVFGPWRWRDEVWDLPALYDGTPYDGKYNSMIVEDVLMMEALDIPCSLYWVDRPWCPGSFGYDDLQYDPGKLPDATAMIAWLQGQGTQFMLWIAPWAMGQMMEDGKAAGYLVQDGLYEFAHPASAKLIDLTNPDAVSWWQDHLIPLIDDGVLGFKLDRGEEKVPDGNEDAPYGEYSDGTSFREGRNAYPYWYARAVQGAFARAGAEEFAVMPRSFWVGSQQHAIVWGGDTEPSLWGLRSAIIAVQRNAAMNFPIWGSDTCGYGRSNHETCARWLAFSAFTPLMEVGPTDNVAPWSRVPDGESGNVGEDGYDYEPEYDAALLAIWNLYANLHNDLLDYSYDQAARAHEQGTPIVRPMIFAYPDRPEYRDLYTQYLYGPDILVRPVWEEGVSEVTVQIPEAGWLDAWTGQEAAPGEATVAVPEHKQPIYVRQGGRVNLGDLVARWQAAQAATATPPDLRELAKAVE